MSRIVALGDRHRLEGFRLAGVEVVPVESTDQARAAWSKLGADTAVVLLTPATEAALVGLLPQRPEIIWTTLPD